MRVSPTLGPSPVTNPLRAWSCDLQARPDATTLAPAESHWLELALALHRLGNLNPEARRAYLDALDDAGNVDGNTPSTEADRPDHPPPGVPSIIRALVHPDDEAARRDALSVVQDIVIDMENHHVFHLAFATLAAARAAFPDLPPLLTGRLLAQQARVARQLGDLDTSADLYAMALDLGTLHDERELIARGHLGVGVVAETHGNFPAARASYLRALEYADASPRVAANVHHGLMVAASKAGDLSTALRHAWAAFEGDAGDPVRRVDRLINLAELARKAGEERVALRAFRTALEYTNLSRLRLPAISGIARAAAVLGERATLVDVAEQAEREAAVNGIPYENAKLWRELAEAFLEFGDTGRAAEYARRAREIAELHAFHEVDIRAEELEQGIARRVERRGALEKSDTAAHEILRRLAALADADRSVVVG